MNTKTTISISEARVRLFEIAEEVQSPHTVFSFTEKGKPKVVMMSAENFESWAETLEVMSDFPSLRKELKETQKAIANKTYKKWAKFDDVFPGLIKTKAVVKKVIKKKVSHKK
ncbi:TPA: hypothetical protein DEP94_03710 [Candidatus Nomurabacteria bacterium]|nr:hypothetical protein [Candidatus Nomurabacteria bacterium]